MYLIGSLLLAFGISIFVVSKIAEMLHAKKPDMGRVFLASLVGGISAFVTLIVLSVFVKNIDPMIMMIGSILSMFIVSTMAFKSINDMSWSGAITTNIANIALVLMTGTAAVVLNGVSLDKTIKSVQNTFHDNSRMVQSMVSNDPEALDEIYQKDQEINEELVEQETIEPDFKEIDMLPESAVKALEAKKKKVYRAPKYQVISISNIRSAVGKNIRIESKNGKSIKGALKNIRAGDAIVEQRINGGLAVTPISFAKIKKLEVYR